MAEHLEPARRPGGFVAPFVIGIALGDLVPVAPIDAQQNFGGTVLDLISPYSLFVGLTGSPCASPTARRSSR